MSAHPVLRAGCLAATLLLGAAQLAAPALAATAPPAAAGTAPPLAAFFNNVQMSDAKLSPDGKFLAVRVAAEAARDGLVVIAVDTLAALRVAQFSNVDIGDFEWVNAQRLIFDSRDNTVAPGDQRHGAGLYAVDREGANFRQLAESSFVPPSTTGTVIKRNVQPWHTFLLGQPGAQTTSHVYVQRAGWNDASGDVTHWDLVQLDTTSGLANVVQRPGKVQSWLLDQAGEPRLAVTEDQGRDAVHYLDPANGKWRKLAEFASFGESPGNFVPLGFGADGKLYVRARAGRDKSGVYLLDLASGQIAAEPLVSLADYDFGGALVYGKGRLLGMQVLSDARSTVWFDTAMKAAQQKIDALLPATVNLVAAAHNADSPWLLVNAYSDTQPTAFLLFNTATAELKTVGHTHPDIVAAQMGTQDLVRYPARDGLSIPAWLTLPRGKDKPLPMVLLVHGGPNLRGSEWGWDAEAQFLASRGYAVLQPEFRGSTGFGAKHFRAGWKQWGLAMQDDLADGVKWAVTQGIADPKRVCIAGASYGGYAALMGLVNDPGLYQCGIDWAGVSDIGKMFSNSHSVLSDMGDEWRNYGMPELIGDPVKDAARFQATSPLAQAARIKQPLLLAHGSDDRRVPLYQGKDFYHAVKAGNPQVEWVVYDGEGHGWSLAKNRIDFWGRVERFLSKHIGAQRQQP
ncbi:alpha/beta hydrolase family protein [Rugamonas rubra]|uniref:Dipeptidyl aminopeptidase/acylaminoacyl peptidase n=1 Tax=Rugamonas rubra TaxID=758825 RepID=A0A1I4HJM6_9BURK|nr:S9 family peptidase [Rugamonas rubra]SFL41731.1 Dipeptidyl aminopeptidase/acylaminoacyl peptidase [Rugamonas rubra]